MSKKKLTKGLVVALVASHLLTGVACNSKDNERGNNKGDTTPISGETLGADVDTNIMLEDVEFETDRSGNYFNDKTAYDLSSAVCNELQEFCGAITGKTPFVSRVITPGVLAGIMFRESSWGLHADNEEDVAQGYYESRNKTDYAGVGQLHLSALMDALDRIKTTCDKISQQNKESISDNYYLKIYNDYGLKNGVTRENAIEIFEQIEKGGEENVKLGAALSAMALNDIGARYWEIASPHICDNRMMVIMSYYCGSQNIEDYVNLGIIQIHTDEFYNESNKVTFNLDKVKFLDGYYGEFDVDSQYGKFISGFTYALSVLNIEDVIENGKKFGKKGDECENIKNDLNSNLSTDNLKKYVEKCGENIVINGSIRDNDLQR